MNLIEITNKLVYDASKAKRLLSQEELDQVYDAYLKQQHLDTVRKTLFWTINPIIENAYMGYHFEDEFIACHYDTFHEYKTEDVIDLFSGFENKYFYGNASVLRTLFHELEHAAQKQSIITDDSTVYGKLAKLSFFDRYSQMNASVFKDCKSGGYTHSFNRSLIELWDKIYKYKHNSFPTEYLATFDGTSKLIDILGQEPLVQDAYDHVMAVHLMMPVKGHYNSIEKQGVPSVYDWFLKPIPPEFQTEVNDNMMFDTVKKELALTTELDNLSLEERIRFGMALTEDEADEINAKNYNYGVKIEKNKGLRK